MASQNHSLISENKNGEKWDRCLTDSIIKTASGLALGFVFSAILFKRRPWPVFLGTGIGIGMAYSNCQNDLRSSKFYSQSLPITRPNRHIPITPSESD
ncbi:unnamed protein product [Rotaria sordida]|uniref:MICOS complex subunit MIC10 n=1 Tax=Rotaria sordida TaxID=392033 RepID=A0A815JN94_9BILA|nr:unnamed protein product [Rotaria sordida]CAF1250540.1 unnamed protein product [Rotaria sordida]CAF1384507.1 unnamed protein product [Rotaria sordida]